MTDNDCHHHVLESDPQQPQHQRDNNRDSSVVTPIVSSSSKCLAVKTSASQQKSSPQSIRRNLNSILMQNQSSFQEIPTSTRKRKRSGIQALIPQLTFSNDANTTPVRGATIAATPTHFSRTTTQTTITLQHQQQRSVSPLTSLIDQLVPNGRNKTSPAKSKQNGNAANSSLIQDGDMTTAEDDSIASFSSDLDSDTAVPAAKQPLPTFASTNSQSPPSTCWQHYDSNRARESRYTTSASEKPTTQTSVNVKIENNATLPNRTHLDENERQSPTTVTPSMSQLDDDDGGSNHDAGAAVAASTTVPIRIQQHNVTGASVHTPEYNPSGGGMRLNAKQAQAVQAIKDKKNVFLTGPAGTGKSVVLRKVLKYCSETYRPNQWVAVAPTGVTAIAIGGQTIHSFAGIGIPSEQEDFNKAWQGEKRQAWRELKIMVMEEISMIAGEFLDRLDSVVRQIRGVDEPFGGIQVLICGDFLQLPPIAESIENMAKMREFVNDPGTVHGNRGFAFQSYFWKEANLETIHLTEVFRQDNPQFVNVLSRIRRGLVGEPAKSFLAQCARPLTLPSKDIEPTRLYSKNVDVNRENMSELVRLDGDTHQFKAIDHVIAASFAKPGAEEKLWNSEFFRQTVAEDLLRLKVGAQVMLIKNDTLNRRTLVNGSRGVVVEFTNEQPEPPFNIPISIPKSNSDQARKEGIYPKVKFQNGETRILGMAEFTSRIVGVGQCIRIAVPLKLAWAITVHKSQGMTLDYVKIDLSGVFCKAQAYVALSRAKDEKCLELRNFSSRLVKADACALAFYDHPNIEINKWDHREKWTRAKVKVESVNNEPPSQEETKESKNQAWV